MIRWCLSRFGDTIADFKTIRLNALLDDSEYHLIWQPRLITLSERHVLEVIVKDETILARQICEDDGNTYARVRNDLRTCFDDHAEDS